MTAPPQTTNAPPDKDLKEEVFMAANFMWSLLVNAHILFSQTLVMGLGKLIKKGGTTTVNNMNMSIVIVNIH